MKLSKKSSGYLKAIKHSRGTALAQFRLVRPSRPSIVRSAPSGQYVKGVYKAGKSGPEVKNIDVTVSNQVVTTAAPYTNALLDTIAEGTTDSNRVGMKIQVKSLDITFNMYATYTGIAPVNATPTFVDVWVLHDRQPDQSGAAAASAIFTAATTNLVRMLPQNLDRYTVLRHERIPFDIASLTASCAKMVDYHIPLDLAVRYADGTGAPVTNDLLVAFLSPCASGNSVFQPNISYQYRVKFTDE